jgi:hypothetical protein
MFAARRAISSSPPITAAEQNLTTRRNPHHPLSLRENASGHRSRLHGQEDDGYGTH